MIRRETLGRTFELTLESVGPVTSKDGYYTGRQDKGSEADNKLAGEKV